MQLLQRAAQRKTKQNMFNTNTAAKAKLTLNKQLQLYTLLVAFTTNSKFTQKQAHFVSGHFKLTSDELQRTLLQAQQHLHTNNIVFVK